MHSQTTKPRFLNGPGLTCFSYPCTQPEDSTTVKAYAEVWGTDETGHQYTPIAWVQAMVDAHKLPSGEEVITLQLHADWVLNVRIVPPA